MKAEHLKEATKLVESLKVAQDHLNELNDPKLEKLKVEFFNRSVSLDKSDPKFENIRRSMVAFLQLRIDNIYRRANQISLNIQPVVIG